MIEIISYQEIKGNDKEIVDREFEKLMSELKNKYNAKVLTIEEDIEELDNEILHTKVGELNIKFNSFLEYIEYCLSYGADLDVVNPSKLKINSKEFGEAIAHIIDFFKKFYDKYHIAFNIQLNEENKNVDIENYKKGIYDEDEIYALQEEEGLLKVKVVFEGAGISEEDVIKKILQSLNDSIVVNKITTKQLDITQDLNLNMNAKFYGLIAVEMFCKPFDIVELAYKYTPVVVSLENREIELNPLELQDIGNELGGAIFELSHATLM
jgi:hypothetical protein